MKKIYILLLLCLVFSSATTVFAQAGDYTTSVMRSREGIFRNPQSSPIVFGERFKNFQGLNWFAINPNYRVIAKFVRTPNEQRFAVPTFGHSETIDIVKYGTLAFTLKGEKSSRVLTLQTLFHILSRDHRIIVVRNDTPRHIAHLT